MVYSPGDRDYRTDAESQLPRSLFIVVAVFGLATYGVSFGPVGAETTGWYVRFAVLAGLVAAFGLLRKGEPYATATAALAAIGFLDALSSLITTGDAEWALTVIVVLNGLQAAAAVAALLLSPEAKADTTTTGYEAYVDYYNQAVRNYYSQQSSMPPQEQMQRGGYGQAYADAQAARQVQRAQRPSQQGDYAALDYNATRPGTAQHKSGDAAASAGMPNVGHTQRPVERQQHDTDQSIWPGAST